VARDLVINVSENVNTIALLEEKQLVELHKEKKNKQFSVGDIYLGRVKKIMSGLNAAFIDIGYERDAFLHYLDLGPQFQSLNNYIHSSIEHPNNTPPLQKFNLLPDINKHGKISEVLTSGQKILVQIAKEPISTKGPRLTSEVSIAGRNLVILPFSEKVSISQKIKSKEERDRLKQLILSIKPKNYGVIVRTIARNRRVAVLDTELRELVEKWENSIKTLHTSKPPRLVIGELDRTSALLRDILNNSFTSINVNDSEIYHEAKDYVGSIAPESEKIVKLYSGKQDIFEAFGIDKQIKTLFGKTVTVKNGAYLIIEHTEALHVVDVNSGNRSNSASDQETNALDVNLSAADEIARQLRLRDMGGIVVIDFIDMHSPRNKKELFLRMKQEMAKDRTKHSILPLSKFGIMQITRQRVRPEMNIETLEACPTCGGTGEIGPSVLFVDEIESNLKYIVTEKKANYITLKVHPYIYAYLSKGLFWSLIYKWKRKYKIKLKAGEESSYNFLEYYFFDKEDIKIPY
jgi:ribonuclease G